MPAAISVKKWLKFNDILNLLREKPMSAADISDTLEVLPRNLSNHLAELTKLGCVSPEKIPSKNTLNPRVKYHYKADLQASWFAEIPEDKLAKAIQREAAKKAVPSENRLKVHRRQMVQVSNHLKLGPATANELSRAMRLTAKNVNYTLHKLEEIGCVRIEPIPNSPGRQNRFYLIKEFIEAAPKRTLVRSELQAIENVFYNIVKMGQPDE